MKKIFKKIHNVELKPFILENNDIEIKFLLNNFVLLSKYKENIVICISGKNYFQAIDFIAKNDFLSEFEIIELDEVSFDKLYHLYLETEKENKIDEINKDHSNLIDNNEELFNINEFLQSNEDILTNENSAPLIQFVNSLFYQSIKQKSSDIHIEIHENKGKIRFRINGSLVDYLEINQQMIPSIISRIKVISNLDIAEKRIPQDGRTQIKIAGKKLDIRVSILPTYYGERVVLRILMQSGDIPTIYELGFEEKEINIFKNLLEHSHGIILVTGPTGSGKSTTLHSFLQEVSTNDKNIITIEDPIEYKSDKINQIQVNSKVGLTFAEGLRSILRQDPDIIMVGEIRDEETARIAIKAAQTGHLVFSTLHTNNATASIIRLIDMGIEPFLISSSVIGIIAQRLVRVLCNECKEKYLPNDEEKELLNINENIEIFKEVGCQKCNFSGYSGRKAIGEILKIDSEFKKLIKKNVDEVTLRNFFIEKENITLQEQFRNLVLNKETSIKEIIRLGIKDE